MCLKCGEGSTTTARTFSQQKLRKFNLMTQFYSAVVRSSVTVWFGSATKTDIRRLQPTVQTAERISGAPCPASRTCSLPLRKRAGKNITDLTHPGHNLELLPSGRWLGTLNTRTSRHRNSFFFPQAISLLNCQMTPKTPSVQLPLFRAISCKFTLIKLYLLLLSIML